MQGGGSYHITLAGIISDENFHKCIACIKELEKKFPMNVSSSVMQFFPTQWNQYLSATQN